MTQDAWMKKLAEEGYHDLNVCEMPADTDFGQHTHDQTTVHVILEGELTMKDEISSVTLQAGDQFEIPAGTSHTATCGARPFKMIVGTK